MSDKLPAIARLRIIADCGVHDGFTDDLKTVLAAIEDLIRAGNQMADVATERRRMIWQEVVKRYTEKTS